MQSVHWDICLECHISEHRDLFFSLQTNAVCCTVLKALNAQVIYSVILLRVYLQWLNCKIFTRQMVVYAMICLLTLDEIYVKINHLNYSHTCFQLKKGGCQCCLSCIMIRFVYRSRFDLGICMDTWKDACPGPIIPHSFTHIQEMLSPVQIWCDWNW